MSTSVNFLCRWETFRLLLSTVHAPGTFRQLPLTFHVARRTSGYIPCGWETFCQLASTFCVAVIPSVHFRQLYVPPGDLASTSVLFCAFRRPSVNFRVAMRPSVYFRQLSVQPRDFLSAFCAIVAPSVKLSQLPMRLETFCQLPSIFHSAGGPSVSIRQLSVRPRDLPSTSVNFLYGWETFCQLP